MNTLAQIVSKGVVEKFIDDEFVAYAISDFGVGVALNKSLGREHNIDNVIKANREAKMLASGFIPATFKMEGSE